MLRSVTKKYNFLVYNHKIIKKFALLANAMKVGADINENYEVACPDGYFYITFL